MKLKLLLATLILCGFAVGPAAGQTLLFSGGEDVDFTCVNGTCTVYTATTSYRAGWARASYGAAATTTDPPGNRFATPTFTANAEIWIHAQYCNLDGACNTNTTSTSNAQLLRVFTTNGNPSLIVRGTGTAGQLKISSRTSGGTFTDLVTCTAAFNAPLTQLDLHINYAASGSVTLYKNS